MSILLQEAKAELGLDVWGDPESEPGVILSDSLSVVGAEGQRLWAWLADSITDTEQMWTETGGGSWDSFRC